MAEERRKAEEHLVLKERQLLLRYFKRMDENRSGLIEIIEIKRFLRDMAFLIPG